MNLQTITLITLLLIAAVATLSTVIYTWRRRTTPGLYAFTIFLLSAAFWSLTEALVIFSPTTEQKVFWSWLIFLGSLSLPVSLFCFIVRFTGNERWLTTLTRLLLYALPTSAIVLLFSNDQHGLMLKKYNLVTVHGATAVHWESGALLQLYQYFSYGLILAGMVILLRSLIGAPSFYRRQVYTIFLAITAPFVAELLYTLVDWTPVSISLTPLAFVFSAVMIAIGVLRFRMMDIVPIARNNAFENMNDGIIILDRQFHIVDINPVAQAISQRAAAGLGKDARQLFPEFAHLSKTLDENEACEVEIAPSKFLRSWYELRISPVRDKKTRLTGWLVVLRNITERKHAEEALRQAKESAEEAARIKSDFLANVSHELRTPLNAVIGMTSLLLDTTLTTEQRNFVDMVRRSGDNLLEMINDLLDYSKIEADKLEMENQPFDLTTCIEDTFDLFAHPVAEKGLELVYLVEEGTPQTIIGDVTRLRQVLANLVSNAIKFTERGQVTLRLGIFPTYAQQSTQQITLRPRETSQPQQNNSEPIQLHFRVTDTGVGIPKTRMDRLFRAFSQVDASTTRRYGGTGLGLAISKRLVELMGGAIWAESREGIGSSFHFTIRTQPVAKVAETQIQPAPLAGKCVLIVDDLVLNQEFLTGCLKQWGATVQAANTADEALMLLQRGEPCHAALINARLNNSHGIDLLQQIRQQLPALHLPVILMTHIHDVELRSQIANIQNATILNKPIKQAMLAQAFLDLFPAMQPYQGIEKPATSPFVPAFSPQKSVPPLKILIAEDNVVNQKVALRILERMGYRADVAANGREVLQALDRQLYDVVLMDVQMPELDGLEATRQIRSTYTHQRQPYIIAMTANAMLSDQTLCLSAGMNDYVSKPIRVEALATALQQVPCKK